MKPTQISILNNINAIANKKEWHKNDTIWLLGLYGTAIGAGVLFLPINAGIGGIIPLIVMTIIAFPLTFFSHRALTRFILSGSDPYGGISEVVEEHFGPKAGNLITLLYFFAIYPTLLMYSVAMTNTLNSFIINQLQLIPPPRVILSLFLIVLMMIIICFGEKIIIKIMSILVYPFIIALILIAFYLIPHWQGAILETLNISKSNNNLWVTLWLAIPVMVFSFNHSPIISSFALVKRMEYGDYAEKKCSRILIYSNLLMVVTVMFFVFSCVLSLSPQDLNIAKKQNITILSYLANHFNVPVIDWLGPPLAIIAITKSFLGHYLGAKEGLNSILNKILHNLGKNIVHTKLNFITSSFILLTAWFAATLNPNILKMIETLEGPIIAIILFLMPMYAIRKVSVMNKYFNNISDFFIVLIGFIAISAIFYSIFY
ncbi:HAAAP family serine/threonine permease [Candidatus Pantoea edessiphila]|uniref:HAAAP family serine/threonine permease n=1 Tax=Candidatus Pantoea edessiphila TaxID=2044610 RepID=A0A2P5SZ54_9GAMM|nr:aromatic amino acid transport family protein [Candidatus Pantoea edessiphila]MBK4775281.1 HAAAP family serine/threonine permease [Pantoea sp. Edef]PPI87580.1 HAAAP family serine/threonine permease [Candidatus Pantoea edessiphila]